MTAFCLWTCQVFFPSISYMISGARKDKSFFQFTMDFSFLILALNCHRLKLRKWIIDITEWVLEDATHSILIINTVEMKLSKTTHCFGYQPEGQYSTANIEEACLYYIRHSYMNGDSYSTHIILLNPLLLIMTTCLEERRFSYLLVMTSLW